MQKKTCRGVFCPLFLQDVKPIIKGLGFGVQQGFRVQGSGLRVESYKGSGFRGTAGADP